MINDVNPNLEYVNINPYTELGKIPSICSQDIERKRNYDGQNDGQPKSSIAALFQSGATKGNTSDTNVQKLVY